MANKNIKGITIQLDGETRGLQAALKDINVETRKMTTELRDVERALDIDPSSTEVLAQKQDVLQRQLQLTTEKLNSLKDAQKEASDALSKGDISQAQYDQLTREIIKTTGEVDKLTDKLKEVDSVVNMSGAEREFEKLMSSMRGIDQETKKIKTELKEVENALKMDPGNAELIAQKQRLIGQEADNASRKLSDLRASYSQVESAAASGDLGADKFDKLKREIIQAESRLSQLDNELKMTGSKTGLDKASKEMDELKQSADKAEGSVSGVGQALAGLGAGLSIGGLLDQGFDFAGMENKIQRATGLVGEQNQEVLALSKNIQAYGVDSDEALEGIRRQWAKNKDATVEANSEIVKQAAAMSQTYAGLDFTEIIQETNEIAGELDISNQEAIALADSLLSIGFPPGELDTIAEYGLQLKQVGFNAQETQAIMASAVATDTWNIDNLLDGLKEGAIRAKEMGDGLSNSMKDAVREATADTEAMTAEQAQAYRKALDQQASVREKALSDELSAVQKQNDKLEDQKQKSLDAQLKSVEKHFDNQQKAIDKANSEEIKQAESTADAKIKAVEKGNEAESKALEKSINSRKSALDKSHNDEIKSIEQKAQAQVRALEKSHDAQIKAVEKRADAEEKALEKAHSEQLSQLESRADASVRALEKQQSKEESVLSANLDKKARMLERSQEKELSDAERLADNKIKLINKEYTERLKLVDEQKYKAIKAVDDEIKSIEDRMAADAKAVEEEEKARQRKELQARVMQAATADEYREAQRALADFEREQDRKRVEEQRRVQIDMLRTEKESINEQFDARVAKIKEEQDATIDSVKNTNKANIEALKARQKEAKAVLDQQAKDRIESLKAEHQADSDLQEQKHARTMRLAQTRFDYEKQNQADVLSSQVEKLKERQELEKASLDQTLAKQKENQEAIQEQQKQALDERTQAEMDNLKARQESETEALQLDKDKRIEAIQERQELEMAAFNERRNAQLESTRAANEAELTAFTELKAQEEEALALAHENEMARINEINAAKVEAAMNPPETALYQETIAQLEAWGEAIAAGGEKGKEAFIGMTEWLDQIENDTLRNKIGVELFGTMWEDQGENIIETIKGMDAHMYASGEGVDALVAKVGNIESDPLVEMRTAVNDMMIALAPLIVEIAKVVGKVAGWVSSNKEMALGIAGTVGVLVGAGGLVAAFNTVKSTIGIVGGALKLAVSTGPWGLAILAIIGAVALIIRYWEPISGFFKKLWSGVTQSFTSFKDGTINNFNRLKEWLEKAWQGIKNIFSGNSLKQAGTDVVDGFLEGIKESWSKMSSTVSKMTDKLPKSVRKVLKINSPSRVFREIGNFTGEGLVAGLEDMNSRVRRAGERMADNAITNPGDYDINGDPRGKSGGYGAGNSTSEQTPNVNINFNGNLVMKDDMDIETLSRKIMANIQKGLKGQGY